MQEPQLETDTLLRQLVPSMESGVNCLTEIQLMGIVRKARQIPDRHEGLLIEGLAKIISGKVEEGIDLCERSISLNKHDHVAWLNFGITLASRGYHSLQTELLWRAMEYDLIDAYFKALSLGTFWLDEKLFNHAFEFLTKAGLIESSLDEGKRAKVKFMQELSPRMELISPFAKIAKEIADKERLQTVNSHLNGDAEHGYCYSLYVRDADCDMLLRLNDLAIDTIIERNLHSLDCITLYDSEVE